MTQDLALASALELVALFRAGKASPVEALEAVLARIAQHNPALNAVIARDDVGARAAAKASEARWRAGTPSGALDGVPLTVKDSITVAGMPCTWGSPVFRDFVPDMDELPVARLRAGGALILGKTNVPEFTMVGYTDNTVFGPTRNPWDTRLTPGGSSGGAVASVAAGFGPVALGTDGGGSIRRPASHVGIFGLKPTPGRIPRSDGLPAIFADLEQIGPLARTMPDLIALTAAISAPDVADPLSRFMPDFRVEAAPKLRILYIPRFASHPVDAEIAASCAAAARAFEALGNTVEERAAPWDVDAINAAAQSVAPAGLAWLMAQKGAEPAGALLRGAAEAGRGMDAPTLFGALHAMREFRRHLSANVFTRWDVLLTPAAAALPWTATESHPTEIAGQPVGPRGHAVFTAFANAAGLPGLTLPCAPAASGLPIGVQLVGAPGSDALLCAVGLDYAAANPHAERRPLLA